MRNAPPPPVLSLADPHVVLRTTAWTELRAAPLAESDDASFEPLLRCETHACVARTDPDLAKDLASFEAHSWRARATASWAGIEAAHAVLTSPAGEALFSRAANDLGATFAEPVVVDVVSEAPALRDRALVPRVLAARGRCFMGPRNREADRAVADARTLDCVLAHVLLRADGPVASALREQLGPDEGARAYTLVVVHVVASLVRSYERHHASVYLRSVRAVEPARMDWLAREWSEGREPPEAFARRFAAAYAE
jgi:hypothetical protein